MSSLKSAHPSKAEAVRLLNEVLDLAKVAGNLPTYANFDAFRIDVDWILEQYAAISPGL